MNCSNCGFDIETNPTPSHCPNCGQPMSMPTPPTRETPAQPAPPRVSDGLSNAPPPQPTRVPPPYGQAPVPAVPHGAKPAQFQTIGTLMLISGIINILTGLAWLVGGLLVCVGVIGIYNIVVGIFEIINASKCMSGTQLPSTQIKTVAILGIVSIITGNLVSAVLEIVVMTKLSEVEGYLQR